MWDESTPTPCFHSATLHLSHHSTPREGRPFFYSCQPTACEPGLGKLGSPLTDSGFEVLCEDPIPAHPKKQSLPVLTHPALLYPDLKDSPEE